VKKLGARKDGDRSLSIVYTPMHGVGDKLARLAFDEGGFTNVVSVPEQQRPGMVRSRPSSSRIRKRRVQWTSAFALARARNAISSLPMIPMPIDSRSRFGAARPRQATYS